ncbi:MAG: UDP-N-acetylmuramoyl-L-alanine--D-glutamate ligase [Clostridia bacterium]|nr:UDP-N-acetylmuramoyl-L-alanine--D-glutamate ligase [Clostridia bacterium]
MEQKTALIVGMAKSGIGSARLLAKNGYRVIINDMKSEIDGLFEALKDIEYINALGKKPETLFDGVDLLVLSPVIPVFAPFAKEAQSRGIEVIGEIELGYRFASRKANFVCISGTNGKTTTTALTGEIFKEAGRNTFVLGNIGDPITEHSTDIKDGDTVVAEVAALQLESIDTFRANAVGMLNITEDHLNRFENKMENYIAAKCRVFENQTENDFAVLNYDDSTVRDMQKLTRAKVVWFSTKGEVDEGAFLKDTKMMWRTNGSDCEIIDISELKIMGLHNVENALCASALSLCMGIEMEDLRRALSRFTAVEHRIEAVREKDGILYINDSKGTNPDSTIKAVEAMTRPTILLLGVGNYDKKSDFVPLFEVFGDTVKAVIVSGINTPSILEAAKKTGFENISVCEGDLEDMVKQAQKMAEHGDVVLLSPAAASWGMFDNFEQRGTIFKEIVNKL